MFRRRRKQLDPADERAKAIAWREFDREQEREAFRGLGPGFGRIPTFGKRRAKS